VAGAPVVEAKAATAFALVAGEGIAHWSGRSYGGLARAGFMKNPVAHRAVRLVAEAAASVPWLAYEAEAEVSAHPALALLSQPNGRQAGPDFFEALYGHLMLSGNAYVEPLVLGDALRELHLLRPDRVSVVEGRDGWITAYDYRAGNMTRRLPAESGGRLSLLHLKLFHPLDDHLGFPPLAAAGAALDLHNAAGEWNKALLDNSARPSGALVYQPKEGGNLSTDQYERLKAELESGYAGAVNAGRPLLLEGGLDWKSMGLSPKDMDFIEAKNAAARDIALSRRAADADGHSGRQYLRELSGSQPRLLSADGGAAADAHGRKLLRLVVGGLWRGAAAGARPRPHRGLVRRAGCALGKGGGGGVPDRGGETAGGGVLRVIAGTGEGA